MVHAGNVTCCGQQCDDEQAAGVAQSMQLCNCGEVLCKAGCEHAYLDGQVLGLFPRGGRRWGRGPEMDERVDQGLPDCVKHGTR